MRVTVSTHVSEVSQLPHFRYVTQCPATVLCGDVEDRARLGHFARFEEFLDGLTDTGAGYRKTEEPGRLRGEVVSAHPELGL